jgi:hypothetical protein
MVLRGTVNAQTVPRAAHAATEASVDKDIKGLIDRRKGQGRMLLPKHLIELLRSGMAVVLFEGGETRECGITEFVGAKHPPHYLSE